MPDYPEVVGLVAPRRKSTIYQGLCGARKTTGTGVIRKGVSFLSVGEEILRQNLQSIVYLAEDRKRTKYRSRGLVRHRKPGPEEMA